MKIIALFLMSLLFAGCTYVKITPESGIYVSVLQRKSGKFVHDPETGVIEFVYASDSDPAIIAFKEGLAAGAATIK